MGKPTQTPGRSPRWWMIFGIVFLVDESMIDIASSLSHLFGPPGTRLEPQADPSLASQGTPWAQPSVVLGVVTP